MVSQFTSRSNGDFLFSLNKLNHKECWHSNLAPVVCEEFFGAVKLKKAAEQCSIEIRNSLGLRGTLDNRHQNERRPNINRLDRGWIEDPRLQGTPWTGEQDPGVQRRSWAGGRTLGWREDPGLEGGSWAGGRALHLSAQIELGAGSVVVVSFKESWCRLT